MRKWSAIAEIEKVIRGQILKDFASWNWDFQQHTTHYFPLYVCVCVCVCVCVPLCLTLCDPKDCSLPGSSVHGIFPARKLEWEKEMATHSSILAWRVPWTEEPGGLLSMGSHRVGHDWSDLAAAAAAISYSRESSQPRDRTHVSCIVRLVLYH